MNDVYSFDRRKQIVACFNVGSEPESSHNRIKSEPAPPVATPCLEASAADRLNSVVQLLSSVTPLQQDKTSGQTDKSGCHEEWEGQDRKGQDNTGQTESA